MIPLVLALAVPRAVTVETAGCGALDGGEIGRLLLLELATEGTPAGDLYVTVECDGAVLIVRIRDEGTGRTISRVIDAPDPGDTSRNRIVALAAAQLLAAAWMDLREPPRPREKRAPRRRRRAPAPRSATRVGFALEPGLRIRTPSDPLLAPRVALRGGVRTSTRWMPFFALGVETGEIDRSGGTVSLLGASGAVGVATRLVGFLDASVSLGVAYLRLQGSPRTGFSGGVTDGLRVEPVATVGPTIETGHLQLGLVLAAGLTLPSLDAEVIGGSPVTTGTAWLGASLALGLLF